MTQGATGRLPAVATALQAGAAVVSSARIFLPSGQRHINDSSVKALLPRRGDLLSLASRKLAFRMCVPSFGKLSEKRTIRSSASRRPDGCRLPQMTLGVSDHGR